jgi:hypothetical protein
VSFPKGPVREIVVIPRKAPTWPTPETAPATQPVQTPTPEPVPERELQPA